MRHRWDSPAHSSTWAWAGYSPGITAWAAWKGSYLWQGAGNSIGLCVGNGYLSIGSGWISACSCAVGFEFAHEVISLSGSIEAAISQAHATSHSIFSSSSIFLRFRTQWHFLPLFYRGSIFFSLLSLYFPPTFPLASSVRFCWFAYQFPQLAFAHFHGCGRRLALISATKVHQPLCRVLQ